MDWSWLVLIAAIVTLSTVLFLRRGGSQTLAKFHLGDITAESLSNYSGYDYSRVRGAS
jgi:hypothetical protein